MHKPSFKFDVPHEVMPYLTPISPESFSKRNLSDEYKLINTVTTDDQYASQLITDNCYKGLNRYIDILPYEHSILKLDEQKLSPDNYINANYLFNPLLPDIKKSFILTQGPLDNTIHNFWNMIDREGVNNILGIVETHSLGSRCAKYWPDKKMKIDNYEIETTSHSKNGLFHKKEFSFSNGKNKTSRTVTHYHLYNWIDFSTLTGEDINGLLNLIEVLYEERVKIFAPIVVHCSAGVGRSGTFAAVYFAYEYWRYCVAKGLDFKISIFDLVLQMRGMRYGLVQTVQQYKFIYTLVSKFKVK